MSRELFPSMPYTKNTGDARETYTRTDRVQNANSKMSRDNAKNCERHWGMSNHREQAIALVGVVIVVAGVVLGLPVAMFYTRMWWCYWGLC